MTDVSEEQISLPMSETPTPTSSEPRKLPRATGAPSDLSWRDLASGRGRLWKLPSREDLINALKTFAWVGPLTLLIWVYAEREQLAKDDLVTIPIAVKSSDPNRIVRLIKPDDKNITATLTGPRAALDHVRELLAPSSGTARIQIEIDRNLTPGQVHLIATEPNVAKNPDFRSSGITVTNCVPDQLQVEVDELVERKVNIKLPPSVTNLASPPVFDPKQVIVRGPKTQLQTAAEEGRLSVFAELVDPEILKTPGHHDIPSTPVTCSLHGENITLTPTTVHAILDIREADVPLHVDAMPIFVMAPTNVSDKYRVVMSINGRETTSLANVTLVGPPKTIEMMQRPDFAPKPKAYIEVSSEDETNPKPKLLQFDKLPEGVVVSPDDKQKTVDIKLIDRSTE
jgi:hypothetical protein